MIFARRDDNFPDNLKSLDNLVIVGNTDVVGKIILGTIKRESSVFRNIVYGNGEKIKCLPNLTPRSGTSIGMCRKHILFSLVIINMFIDSGPTSSRFTGLHDQYHITIECRAAAAQLPYAQE